MKIAILLISCIVQSEIIICKRKNFFFELSFAIYCVVEWQNKTSIPFNHTKLSLCREDRKFNPYFLSVRIEILKLKCWEKNLYFLLKSLINFLKNINCFRCTKQNKKQKLSTWPVSLTHRHLYSLEILISFKASHFIKAVLNNIIFEWNLINS